MIRVQYHGRQTPGGFLVWDVRKLIQQVEQLTVIHMPLADIRELNEPYWYGSQDPTPTCRHIGNHFNLVQAASLDFPIMLCAEGRVMDGMHRVVKAYCAGRVEISARQFEVTPKPDFVDVNLDDLPYDD